MRRTMAHSALTFASVLAIAALAGCGGGGKTAVPLPMPVTAPGNSPLAPGATSIPAGESRTVGEADGVRTVATCPPDGPACLFTVAQDGSATFTGGEPMFATYTTITGLPEGHSLATGTLPPGESRTVRDANGMRTVVTCPAGGEACMVSVGDDGRAEATGGVPTVATISYTTLTGLPEGHSLATGTIPAGESRTVRDANGMRTVVTCPAGGAACMVSVGDDGRAEATGGVPTVATISYTTLTGLPEGHSLASGTIPAGESRTVRDADGMRTVVTCPAGGDACVVSVGDDGAAEATGGVPTVMTISYTTITELPEGHSLATGTIPAGESRTVRDANGMRTVVTCPAGAAACMVTVGEDGRAEATGGVPTVVTISYTTITELPEGHSLATGTIPAGESRTVRDADGMRTVVTCPAGGEACMVTIGEDGRAEATGGAPTVATISYTTITGLPEGHSLATGTIPAGESRTVRDADGMRTVVTCPADGEACMVTVGEDGRAEATGGAPTVATISYTTLTGLPEGHSLATGTIPAGESRTVRDADGMRTVVTCPAGGEACMVTVGEDGGAEATGGAPTVVTISYTTLTGLPEGALEPGTFSLSPGQSRVLQETAGMRTLLTCPAGGEDCVVTVGDDGAATATGGAPTVATYTPIALPGGHTLTSGTLPPGETLTVWSDGNVGTLVTCPADGEACVFRVVDGAAEYTGGTPAVTTEITGLSGHTLTAGTTIPAGGSKSAVYSRGRGSNAVCPAGGEDCFVAWVSDSIAEFTGGAPTLAAVNNEMVWQANNGPDGTSDGAHARGLQPRLLAHVGNTPNALFTRETTRAGAIVQSTPSSQPTAAPTASWASGTAPTLGLTMGTASFSVDGDGSIPSLGEGWNGVAMEETTSATLTRRAVLYSNIERPSGGTPDGYYLTLGAWLVMPLDPGTSTAYDMGVFAAGHAATALTRNNVIALTGQATFVGPATGLYSAATYTGVASSRALQSAHVGSFTATATINADFDAQAGNGSVGGSITDFRENGEPLGDWTVNLWTSIYTRPATVNIHFASSGGSADGRGWSGHWGVQYFRNSATSGAEMAVGTFSASTSNATANNDVLHVAGAFGAERQP